MDRHGGPVSEFDREHFVLPRINCPAVLALTTGALLSGVPYKKGWPGMAPTQENTSRIGSGARPSFMPASSEADWGEAIRADRQELDTQPVRRTRRPVVLGAVSIPGTVPRRSSTSQQSGVPQAGYNPVITFSSEEKPDGKVGARTEWQWKVFNDTYVPVAFKQVAYGGPDGTLNLQLDATLEDCVVNKPLDPHQFDPEGLGLKDGDEVMDIP